MRHGTVEASLIHVNHSILATTSYYFMFNIICETMQSLVRCNDTDTGHAFSLKVLQQKSCALKPCSQNTSLKCAVTLIKGKLPFRKSVTWTARGSCFHFDSALQKWSAGVRLSSLQLKCEQEIYNTHEEGNHHSSVVIFCFSSHYGRKKRVDNHFHQ